MFYLSQWQVNILIIIFLLLNCQRKHYILFYISIVETIQYVLKSCTRNLHKVHYYFLLFKITDSCHHSSILYNNKLIHKTNVVKTAAVSLVKHLHYDSDIEHGLGVKPSLLLILFTPVILHNVAKLCLFLFFSNSTKSMKMYPLPDLRYLSYFLSLMILG